MATAADEPVPTVAAVVGAMVVTGELMGANAVAGCTSCNTWSIVGEGILPNRANNQSASVDALVTRSLLNDKEEGR